MHLLMEWREEVVRDNRRVYTASDNRTFPMSLSGLSRTPDGGSCMSCHHNKDKFCDRCHAYLAVQPYCWECHVAPKEGQ
jgi:hypothetical protein